MQPEQYEAILEDWRNKMSIKEIVAKHDVNPGTVLHVIRVSGEEIRKPIYNRHSVDWVDGLLFIKYPGGQHEYFP